MNTLKTIITIIIVVAIVIGFSSFFTVSEGYQALLLRFGKIQKKADTDQIEVFKPGFHFKVPFIEQAHRFDTRIQTADIRSSRIVTERKKYVIVDYYVKWQIDDLPLFFTSTTNGRHYQSAQELLREQLNDALRAQFGKRTIQEVVSEDRAKIMKTLLKQADKGAQKLGINVVDVRIKKIELPDTVTNSVFQQMRAERKQVANAHRSNGKAQAQAIRAKADANVTLTVANAKMKAAKIRAKGKAKAAQIYAKAYQQNPSFYSFYRSLLAYQHSFHHKNDMLLLSPQSHFFNYFNQIDAVSEQKASRSND